MFQLSAMCKENQCTRNALTLPIHYLSATFLFALDIGALTYCFATVCMCCVYVVNKFFKPYFSYVHHMHRTSPQPICVYNVNARHPPLNECTHECGSNIKRFTLASLIHQETCLCSIALCTIFTLNRLIYNGVRVRTISSPAKWLIVSHKNHDNANYDFVVVVVLVVLVT